MLELRPSCEHCNKTLPPASLEARICSYECHLLRSVRGCGTRQCLPELWRRFRAAAGAAGTQLEGWELS